MSYINEYEPELEVAVEVAAIRLAAADAVQQQADTDPLAGVDLELDAVIDFDTMSMADEQAIVDLLDNAEDLLADLDPEAADTQLDKLADNIDRRLALVADARAELGEVLRADPNADVSQLIADTSAALRVLADEAKLVLAQPAAEVVTAVAEAYEQAAVDLRAGALPPVLQLVNDVLASISAQASEYADPGDQFWQIKGMLLEAMLASHLTAERARNAEPNGFISGSRVRDRVSGKLGSLGDGMDPVELDVANRRIGEATFYEAKSGFRSALKLERERQEVTKADVAEARRSLIDDGFGMHPELRQMAERLARQTERTGQLERTKARAETAGVYVDGVPFTIDAVRVVPVLPKDVPGPGDDSVHLDVTVGELETLAKAVQDSLAKATEAAERRRREEEQR